MHALLRAVVIPAGKQYGGRIALLPPAAKRDRDVGRTLDAMSSPEVFEDHFHQLAQVMKILGYSDTTSFWQAEKRAGIPYVRISARRAIFEKRAVQAWIDQRTIGAPLRHCHR